MFLLSVLVNPCAVTPGFLIPLFVSHSRSNDAYVQIIDRDGCASGFVPVGVDLPTIPIPAKDQGKTLSVGDPALWAFAFNDTETICTIKVELKELLETWLSESPSHANSFLCAEVASFCGMAGLQTEFLVRSYKELLSRSRVGAEVWRDIVVILPAVRRDLEERSRRQKVRIDFQEFKNIELAVVRRRVEVKLPDSLYELASQAGTRQRFPEAVRLAKLFNLGDFEVVRLAPLPIRHFTRLPGARSDSGLESTNVLSIIESLGRVGDYVGRKQSISGRQRNIVSPQSLYDSASLNLERWQPFVRFTVFRNEESELSGAVESGRQSANAAQLRIAIPIQRDEYGAQRQGTPSLSSLANRLQNYEGMSHGDPRPKSSYAYDTAFFVGGHVLQGRSRSSPTVWSLGRGAALAESCAICLVSLAERLGREEFDRLLRSVPNRSSLGLGVRKALRRGETSLEACGRALGSLLNPELPLANASTIYLLLPEGTTLFAEEICHKFGSEWGLSPARLKLLPSSRSRSKRYVGIVAPSVPVIPISQESFLSFCIQLFRSQGWLVQDSASDARGAWFIATRHYRRAAIVTVAEANWLGRALDLAYDGTESWAAVQDRLLVSAFKPPRVDQPIVHFSKTEVWFREHDRSSPFAVRFS